MTSREYINDPETVAQLTACCDEYERALVTNDTERLGQFFWDSPLAVRFGVSEELYGAAAIAEFRAQRRPDFSQRKLLRHSLLTFGDDFGISMLEVRPAEGRHGRQTQVWVRLPDIGWRIVSAHVSDKLRS
jgi:hypothetical protein